MGKLRILIAGVAAIGLFTLAAAAPVGAVDFGSKLALHGYGNWAYGKTDGNTYVMGNDEGTWDTMEFSLGVTAEPVERFTVHAQAFWEMFEGEAESSVDFAFGEYAFSPALAFRIGRVKQPFGIYTEIFDVGVLAPFNNLAQGIYGPSGFVAEAYMGVGFTGVIDLTPTLHLQYDLYGGEVESALTTPWAEAVETADGDEQSTDVQDVVGGRVQVGAVDGTFTVGASAYSGTADTKSQGEESEGDRHTVVGAHAEVMLNAFTLRTEYAYQDNESFTASAAYAEASYRLTPHWQVALRYDWTKVSPEEDAGVASELLESTDIGVAVDYFFNPNFVLKLAYHAVDGNRFTGANEDGDLEDKTNLVTFGASFSF